MNSDSPHKGTERYPCYIEDGTVFVKADMGRVEVGPIEDVLKHFGEEYEISYDEWEKERYDVSFADEGLVMNVRQTIESMTLDEAMVEWLKDKPLESSEDATFESGRMALFTGFVGYDLDHGPR